MIDATGKGDGETVDVADFEAGLEAAGHTLAPLDIVLVRTGRDLFYCELDYIARGPAVTADATHWLFDQGVRVMGIDAWGWDGPLHIQAEAARAAGRPGCSGRPTRPTCPTRRSSACSTWPRSRRRASRSHAFR